MRPFVATGLAAALVMSLGVAACNDDTIDDSVNTTPPPIETDPAAPAVTPPVEDPMAPAPEPLEPAPQ